MKHTKTMVLIILLLSFASNINAMDASSGRSGLDQTNEAKRKLIFKTSIDTAQYKPFSKEVIVGASVGVFILDPEAIKIKKLTKACDEIDSLALSSDSRQVIVGSFLTGQATVLDADTLAILSDLKRPKEITDVDSITAVSYGANGEVAAGYDNGMVSVWDAKSAEQIALIQKDEHDKAAAQAIAYNRERLIVAYSSGELMVYDPHAAEKSQILLASTSSANCISCHHDDRSFVSGSNDGVICLWDLNKASKIQQLATISSRVKVVSCTIAGLIAAGHEDGTICVCDLRVGKAIRQSKEHTTSAVSAVDWRYDGRKLVSTCHDGTLSFWDWLDIDFIPED